MKIQSLVVVLWVESAGAGLFTAAPVLTHASSVPSSSSVLSHKVIVLNTHTVSKELYKLVLNYEDIAGWKV